MNQYDQVKILLKILLALTSFNRLCDRSAYGRGGQGTIGYVLR